MISRDSSTGSWFNLGHISSGFSVSLRLLDCLIFVMLVFDIYQIIHKYILIPNLLEAISPYLWNMKRKRKHKSMNMVNWFHPSICFIFNEQWEFHWISYNWRNWIVWLFGSKSNSGSPISPISPIECNILIRIWRLWKQTLRNCFILMAEFFFQLPMAIQFENVI